MLSGKQLDRPALNALVDYARARDPVCMVRLDRFGRSLKELLETVELFKARQTRLRKELRKANSL